MIYMPDTMHGVEQTPEVLVRAVQSLGASRWAVFRHVVIPAALPSIAVNRRSVASCP